MSEKEGPLPAREARDEEASAWVVRMASDQCTRQDEAEFEQWLGEEEGNRERFEEGFDFWNELGSLSENPDALAELGHLYSHAPQGEFGPARWSGSRRALIGGGLGALAATVAGVMILPNLLTGGAVTYRTAKGEQRRIALADGTSVMLDTATQMTVDMQAGQRIVRLVEGQAFFDVASDPTRPFRVFAGKDEVRALGTAFEVRFEQGSARVILEEGRVAIFRTGADRPLGAVASVTRLEAAKADLIMKPGQEVKLAAAPLGAAQMPPSLAEVDLAKTNAWRDGEMVFDDVSLGAAVAEVNRYGGQTIILGDPSLAELRVSGTFQTNRPQAFVEGVTAALPVRLAEANPDKLVLRKL
jgi:transmembrane sensor